MTLQERYDWIAIQRDYDTGMTVRQVAAKYGMNKNHFDRGKAKGIFEPRLASESGPSQNIEDKYDWVLIQKDYDSGLTYEELSKKHGVATGSLQKARKLCIFNGRDRNCAIYVERRRDVIRALSHANFDWEAIQADHILGFTWDQLSKKYNISISAINNANKSGLLVLRKRPEAAKLIIKRRMSFKQPLSQDEFTSRAVAVHSYRYNYSNSIYTGMNNDVIIGCAKHGDFSVSPLNHIHHSTGCPKCSINVSKPESRFLDLMQIPASCRQIRVGRYTVDGIDHENRIIYEFDGDYWHGNPKTFAPNATNKKANKKFWQLYLQTLRKKSVLEDMGYEVINIWESDLPLFERLHAKNNA